MTMMPIEPFSEAFWGEINAAKTNRELRAERRAERAARERELKREREQAERDARREAEQGELEARVRELEQQQSRASNLVVLEQNELPKPNTWRRPLCYIASASLFVFVFILLLPGHRWLLALGSAVMVTAMLTLVLGAVGADARQYRKRLSVRRLAVLVFAGLLGSLTTSLALMLILDLGSFDQPVAVVLIGPIATACIVLGLELYPMICDRNHHAIDRQELARLNAETQTARRHLAEWRASENGGE